MVGCITSSHPEPQRNLPPLYHFCQPLAQLREVTQAAPGKARHGRHETFWLERMNNGQKGRMMPKRLALWLEKLQLSLNINKQVNGPCAHVYLCMIYVHVCMHVLMCLDECVYGRTKLTTIVFFNCSSLESRTYQYSLTSQPDTKIPCLCLLRLKSWKGHHTHWGLVWFLGNQTELIILCLASPQNSLQTIKEYF